MLREIIFRGKHTRTGEWVEGLLWKKKYNDNKLFISCFPDEDDNEEIYIIKPETIGQYTGLTDKNGTKIFEGDIVRISERGNIVNGKIIFKNAYKGGWLVADKTEQSSCSLAMRNNVKVIGNIHDNPELLESEVEGE